MSSGPSADGQTTKTPRTRWEPTLTGHADEPTHSRSGETVNKYATSSTSPTSSSRPWPQLTQITPGHLISAQVYPHRLTPSPSWSPQPPDIRLPSNTTEPNQ